MHSSVFKTGFFALLLAGVALSGQARAQTAGEVRIIASGGASGESYDEGYVKPFIKKTGIKAVRETITTAPLGRLRAIVESGRIDAELLEIGGSGLAQAKALGIIEKLDWKAIDPAPLYPEAQNEYGLGTQYFAVIMAWRADAKPLSSWQDFWNIEKFPGRRSLPDIPYYAIPIALLADGVALDKVYPIDLDRAFRSLDRIKKHVSVWWQTGQQPVQLMTDNEVQYAAPYSGRVTGNAKFGYSFNQGMMQISYLVMPKGVPDAKKAAAWKFLHEASLAENQAIAARVISYTGGSRDLDKLLPQDRLAEFPTTAQNKAKQLPPNDAYWFENAMEVERRWQQFKLGL